MSTRAQELPPFSGVSGQCPKCGLKRLSTDYHPCRQLTLLGQKRKPPPCEEPRGGARPGVMQEHLCRTCEICGYGWSEATAVIPERERLPYE